MTSTLHQPPARARRAPARSPLWRWLWRLVLAAALVLVLYILVTFVQVWLASRRDAAQSADAIVVLGAAQYDCRPSPVLVQRLDHARALYTDGVAGTIVVTGGKRDGDRCTEAQSSADYLRAAGVPDDDLLLEVQGRSSWQSLAATSHILRDRGLTRVVLVTDGYHALRVQAIADQLGLDASVSPSQRGGSPGELVKETVAVAVGRVIGFDRLVDIDDQIERSRPVGTSDALPSDVRSEVAAG
ncbi:MAG TPA: YdcF family protein [Acidimicrobiales bacterium]|nr:YdcF family protein [Acidimicrobiales bacterium]